MADRKILIAGAGIGGLAAASSLMKAGFDVEVHEQAPALGEVGAGIQLSANAMHVLRHLGLGDSISNVGVRPGAYVFRLHDTGEVIQRFPLSAEHERQHGAPISSCIAPTCMTCWRRRRANSSRTSSTSITGSPASPRMAKA